MDKPRTIAELQREMELTRHQINERLRKLRECEVVREERDGRWLVFSVDSRFKPTLVQLLCMDRDVEIEFSESAPNRYLLGQG